MWRRLRKLLDRALLRRTRRDQDIDDEIRFHLAEEARLQAERGLTPGEARGAAGRAFGNVARAKEDTRAVWVSTRLEQLAQDLRFGFRILTSSPALSATAVLLIAVVIGGNTTVFSIAHGIITKPASGVHATGIATVSWIGERGDVETHAGYPVYAHFLEHSSRLASVAAFDGQRVTLTHDNGSYAVRVGIVSPNYFDTLGVRLVKGRGFTADEAQGGRSGFGVVVSHHLWQNAFQSVDNLASARLAVNGQPAAIVGVAAADFRGAWLAELADIWVPLDGQFRQWLQPNRSGVAVAMFGVLAPGASLAEAQSEISSLWSGFQRANPEVNQQLKVRLVPYSATAGGNSIVSMQGTRMLAIFSVVTLMTIAIVCANVANLLIARAVVRQREVALRQSLGASRARIVRSLLAEGLALSVVAWLAACLFAWFVSRSVVSWLAPMAQGEVVMPDLTPDWTVVGYALLLALICTVVVTLAPALRTWRQQLLPLLKVGEQSVVQSRSKLSSGLVVLQLAFSVVLLTSAGLAYRSLSLQDSLDVGFDTRHILMATVNTSGSTSDAAANGLLIEGLRERLERLPGVQGLSYAPGARLSSWMQYPLRPDVSASPVLAAANRVAPGMFTALGVPFITGADFTPGASKGVPPAIVTQDLARLLWPGEPALGKTLIAGPPERRVEAQVIGVVGDAYFTGRVRASGPRYVFFAYADSPMPGGETTFYLRHSGSRDAAAPALARALREVDPRVAIASVRSLESYVASEVMPLWILAFLLTAFAGGSLFIAAIGQYAVVAFDGRRRSREFGVRIALGASSQQLIRSVVGESFRLTLVGLGLGFALSVAVGSVLARVLYGITATDPLTYVSVFLLLAAASLLASYLPARRAATTDPMLVLRTE